jgi:predicted TIM-barrel fold metal-dependent hydrolase
MTPTATTAATVADSGLLPDPEPRPVRYTVISVDDHLVEPADVFEGRLPKRFADRAPKVIEHPTGEQEWVFDGQTYPQMGFNALVGRVNRDDYTFEPTRFDQMRRGCWDIHARVRDMDVNGVWASVCFPSMITGFCGRIYSAVGDRELGLAVTKAWNDWLADVWWGSYPERIVPMGITYLADPVAGAEEIRRNAARGFVAVSLPERPDMLGYPSVHSGYWDPVLAACAETGTVVCLHVASSGSLLTVSPDAPPLGPGATLFQAQAYMSCVDWLWSFRALQFPELKIAVSEGGIGWVPMLMDRLDFMMSTSGHGRKQWPSQELSPTDVLRRNFWFCTIDDPTVMVPSVLERIGIDHVMFEVDYPHADTTWPDTQDYLERVLAGLPVEHQRKITHENAAALFRHPLPPTTVP